MNISEVMPNGNVRVVVPIRLRKTVQGRVITVAENVRTVQNQTPLLAAIGCGILWQQWLDEGLFANVRTGGHRCSHSAAHSDTSHFDIHIYW